jgi:shikimate kinase
MNIFLCGYMGVGKSTVGKILAARLQYSFVDLDLFIEDREGMSVPSIFSSKGETIFRELEQNAVLELLKGDHKIIALGGGSLENPNINKRIRSSALLIYLEAGADFLYKRLINEKSARPLIATIDDKELLDFIIPHLAHRENNYQKAQLKINVENKSPEEIAAFLIEYMDLI